MDPQPPRLLMLAEDNAVEILATPRRTKCVSSVVAWNVCCVCVRVWAGR